MKPKSFLSYILPLLFALLSVAATALDLPIKTVKGIDVYYYKVSNNESVYGISRKLGIPREDIVRHNPSASDGVQRGMMLYFPVSEYSEPEVTELDSSPEIAVLSEEVDTVLTNVPSIALLLPFGLNAEEPSRENKLALDFYKGFLIGADTLVNNACKIDIYAFDTDDKSKSVSDVLGADAVRNAAVVLAPSDAKWLSAVADAAKESGSYVLNVFVMHDSLYLTNPHVIQANIPQKDMYRLAADALLSRYAGYKPVILRNKEGRNEKEAFVNYLTARYRDEAIVPILLEYENTLQIAEIEALPVGDGERYVFIPSSGSLAEFNRFAYVVKSLRDKVIAADLESDPDTPEGTSRIEIFGYPDWTAFRGDALDTLHKLGATIYSRFNANNGNESFRNVEGAFRHWYGTETIESVPNQAILGYDTACLLINNLTTNSGYFDPVNPHRFEGVQSTFDFEKVSDGYCNATLYIISYLPGGIINVRIL